MEIGRQPFLNIYSKGQKFSPKRANFVRSRANYKPRFGLYNSRFGLCNSNLGLYQPNLELKKFFVVMKFPTFVVDFATFIDDFATLSGDNAARERKGAASQKKIPEPHQCGSGIIVRLSTALKMDALRPRFMPLRQERQRFQEFQEFLRWREPCRNLCSRLWRGGCTTARVCGCRSGGRGRDPRRGGQCCP